MWQKALVHQLTQDILPLRRQGADFTWKTLDELRNRLVRATVYECGSEAEIEEALLKRPEQTRPGLFDADNAIRPLPQAFMLMEFTDAAGTKKAALATDRMDSVEIYIFRFDEKLGRWRWPLMGMSYGPAFEQNTRVAVYEPTALAKSGANAQKAMVQEHVLGARLAAACLELARCGLAAPLGEAGPSAAEIEDRHRERIDLPTPSSFAKAGRNRHETGRVGKGAHRM
ncbi:MAG: hypothetical protein Q4F72_08930 [Desulfovibrionaceae bacterium]|nr:hypothetical protein [Desulfovibrionaceae bacterium]